MKILGLAISSPYASVTLDSRAVQNLEGFWFMIILNSLVSTIHSSIPKYHIQFSIIHRDIHNEVYSLSAFYVSELIITVRIRDLRSMIKCNKNVFILQVVWTVIKMLFFSIVAFTVVGIEWGGAELLVILMVAVTGLSHGNWLFTMNIIFIHCLLFFFLPQYIY